MQHVLEKAKPIRLLILDVDGVLTSGATWYGPEGALYRAFHLHDGLGIKMLQQTGVLVGIISGKKTAAVEKRLAELNIAYVYLGIQDKLQAYEDLKRKLGFSDHEIAYVGDDLPDLPVLRQVGLAITVPIASAAVREHTDWTTTREGGQGAVREVCELIMQAQNQLETVIKSYL